MSAFALALLLLLDRAPVRESFILPAAYEGCEGDPLCSLKLIHTNEFLEEVVIFATWCVLAHMEGLTDPATLVETSTKCNKEAV